LPWFVFFHSPPTVQVQAATAVSTWGGIAAYCYLVGFITLLFGLLALFSYAGSSPVGSLIRAALVLDVIAVAMSLPVTGVELLARPVVAEYYLSGHNDAGSVLLQVSGGSFAPSIVTYFVVAVSMALLGAIATGVALWQSELVPKTPLVLFAVGFALTMTLTPLVGWLGDVLLFVGGAWIAHRLRQDELPE
jgi:hypothetical protein